MAKLNKFTVEIIFKFFRSKVQYIFSKNSMKVCKRCLVLSAAHHKNTQDLQNLKFLHCFRLLRARVADTHHFNADSDPSFSHNADPDIACQFNADPDPDPAHHQSNGNLRPESLKLLNYNTNLIQTQFKKMLIHADPQPSPQPSFRPC
jgi:hypothetical protein